MVLVKNSAELIRKCTIAATSFLWTIIVDKADLDKCKLISIKIHFAAAQQFVVVICTRGDTTTHNRRICSTLPFSAPIQDCHTVPSKSIQFHRNWNNLWFISNILEIWRDLFDRWLKIYINTAQLLTINSAMSGWWIEWTTNITDPPIAEHNLHKNEQKD